MKILGQVTTYLLLGLAALLSLIPFLWLGKAALSPSDQVFSGFFTPFTPTIDNTKELLAVENPSFLRSLFNSLFLACAGVMLQLFFCSLAGFALAKYEFKGKKALMAIQLLTVFIPGAVTLGPGYQLMYQLGLVNSYSGMLIGSAGNVFGIFLFRQAILGVPDELLERGPNRWQFRVRYLLERGDADCSAYDRRVLPADVYGELELTALAVHDAPDLG
ncbi:MAG: carbohydrate ABC transporter permease [Armatimonas sp.]